MPDLFVNLFTYLLILIDEILGRHAPPSPIDSAERDSLNTANLNEIEQSEWLSELQSRGSKIVQVLYPRTANNSQELSVIK